MSLFRSRSEDREPEENNAAPGRAGPDASPGSAPGETTSWFEPVTRPVRPAAGARPSPQGPPGVPQAMTPTPTGAPAAPPGGPWPPPPAAGEWRPSALPGPGAAGPPPAGMAEGGDAPAAPPSVAPAVSGAPAAGDQAPAGSPAAPPDGPAAADAREGGRPRPNHRRPMRRGLRIGLQLVAAVVLTGGLLGAKLVDQLIRYEMMAGTPKIRHVKIGEVTEAQHSRWRLVSIERMQNPPPDTRPDRTWLQLKLEVTPLSEKAPYRYAAPPMELHDEAGHSWHVEKLKGPVKEIQPGQTAEFIMIAVAPKHLADRVEPVLWLDGYPGSGRALRFDR